MSTVADIQAYNLAFQNRTEHTLQGDTATVVLETLGASNTVTDLLTVKDAPMRRVDYQGRQLPPGVEFELHIAEATIDLDDLRNVSGVRRITPQGTLRHVPISPSPFSPEGLHRFW